MVQAVREWQDDCAQSVPEVKHCHPAKLILSIKATECVNRCRHCWAQGHPPLQPMDFTAIKAVAEGFRRGIAGTGFTCVCIMLGDDIWSRSDAVSLWQYQKDFNDGLVDKVILTNGFLFAHHHSYGEIIDAARAAGLTRARMSVHGLADVHDWFSGRPGAYADLTLAARRLVDAGIKVEWNVYIHKPNVDQFHKLIETLRTLTADGDPYMNVMLPLCTPNRRLAEYESFRITTDDLKKLDIRPIGKMDFPSFLTEGAVTRAVLTGEHDLAAMEQEYLTYRRRGTYVPVTCDRNLDVFEGAHGNYERYHGSLNADGFRAVIESIIAYRPAELPSPVELARLYGDQRSTKLHCDDISVGRRWLGEYWSMQTRNSAPCKVDPTQYALA